MGPWEAKIKAFMVEAFVLIRDRYLPRWRSLPHMDLDTSEYFSKERCHRHDYRGNGNRKNYVSPTDSPGELTKS